ncbi:MAG: hypothetical protein WC718_15405 [Phycisphaerales bacterium]|jgi:hypothetical protein
MSDADFDAAHQRNSGSGIDDAPVRYWHVCAWCQDIIEAGDPGAPVTHTICGKCSREQERIDAAGELGRLEREWVAIGREK